ncbi:cell division protein [Clostridioides sp. ES-S-0049-02]|uniref:cell division protein n=1 Tax=Clostridioides sp. ES-S-0049-02 TaxID=2770778 RepID=UPI001D12194B|nr:cell division protein [Clostridioides sp. ES-S-0049-02]
MESFNKNAKIIGIGAKGINIINEIEEKVKINMDIEKITMNQEVEKEYVRSLLDGVDILFLAYSAEDKQSREVIKAISYMSNERRILSIGINSSEEENKDDLGINREFKVNENSILKFVDLMNVMIESISDSCMINIDISDLKEAIISDKGIKYSFEEFEDSKQHSEIVDILFENMEHFGEEFIGKKGIVFVEGNDKFSLVELNDLMNNIQSKVEEGYEIIFSLYLKENLDGKIKVGMLYN